VARLGFAAAAFLAFGGRADVAPALALGGFRTTGFAAAGFAAAGVAAGGRADDGFEAGALEAAGFTAAGFAAARGVDPGAAFFAGRAREGGFFAATAGIFRDLADFLSSGMADGPLQTGFAWARQGYSALAPLFCYALIFFGFGAIVHGVGGPTGGDSTPCPLCGGVHDPGGTCPRLAPTRVLTIRDSGILDPAGGRDLAAGPDASPAGSHTLLFGGDALPPLPPPPAQPAVPAVDPLVGMQVGSFRLVRLLGRGGMGAVYLAEHPVIGSRVAVKFLHEALAENPQVVARFYDEARAVNLIGHENIVAIYDLNLLPPNRYYFVMEYLDGAPLSELERRGRLEPRAALEILLQLTDALQCAHDRGVVHRDLKPDNVFLVQRSGRPDFVKLLDFGIAKLRDLSASLPGRTAAGLIVGTPEYMAPEQCDDGAIDARTDVYSLGVIAYELATGRLPFEGRTLTQLLLAHLRQKPRPPSELAPELDRGLERAILRALEKDPAARHQDMAAFGAALRATLDRLEARAAGAELPEPSATAPPVAPAPRRAPDSASPGATPKPASPTLRPPPPAAPPAVAPRREGGPGVSPPTAPSSVVARTIGPAPAPAPASAAVAPSAPSGPAAEPIRVELQGPGGPRQLEAAEVTRAGLFLRAEADLPRLFSRVELTVSHPVLRARLSLVGEVVRHVSPAEAAQWNMAPGFAVQLADLTPERRAALADLAEASRAAPPAATPAPAPRSAAERLAELEARPAASHYAFLGLPLDAEFSEVRRAARELRVQLEAVRAHPEAADHHPRATALLARLDAAQHALSAPAERLRYDAQRGNYLGVARCVAAGIPPAVVEARRREYLAAAPGKDREAQAHLARAQVARKLGNLPAAVASFEAALAADPLHLATLDAYVAFRRDSGGG